MSYARCTASALRPLHSQCNILTPLRACSLLTFLTDLSMIERGVIAGVAENRAMKSYLRTMAGTTPGTTTGLTAVEATSAQALAVKYLSVFIEQSDKIEVEHNGTTYEVYPETMLDNEGSDLADELTSSVVRAMELDEDNFLHSTKVKAIATNVKMSMRSRKRVFKDTGKMELTKEDLADKGRTYEQQKKKRKTQGGSSAAAAAAVPRRSPRR